MELFIDCTFLDNSSGDRIVKEFCAVGDFYDNEPPSWKCALFLPPCHWESLPAKIKSTNLWTMRNCTGIPWDAGDVPQDQVEQVVKTTIITANPYYIFVDGEGKKQWLEELIGASIPIIEINMMGYHGCNKSLDCDYNIFHKCVRNPRCACQNAYGMYEWYKFRWGTNSQNKSILLYLLLGESIFKMAPKDVRQLSDDFMELVALEDVNNNWESMSKTMIKNNEIKGYRSLEQYDSVGYDVAEDRKPLICDCCSKCLCIENRCSSLYTE
ncbi:uncharacterized protein LOC130673943 [Microplitis mediator]|uniref:uncharacterized protein LOC130673943 n=1 Tax=Microplitis mediator TaxID=375433 RepID=UPI002555412F|nr:uncharacterized protein LOC130673943 [Microplitis mediator]